MASSINMPQVGQDLETAIISEWCVKENDIVKKGDIIAVVESDKASFEVEAFESGTILKILFEEGDEATVFKPIAYIGNPGEIIEESGNAKVVDEPDSQPPTTDSKIESTAEITSVKVLATPVVKRMAKEYNIDISTVPGSGPNGRILKEDILKLVKIGSDKLPKSDGKPSTSKGGDQQIEYSKMRQAIADRLVESTRQIPHFYLFIDVDVTDMLDWRHEKNKLKGDNGKISVNDILIMSVANTLSKFPQMNAHVSQKYLTLKSDINIGLAVSVEDGLIVPVIEKADEKKMNDICKESKEIIESARKGMIKSHAPGTFTISNLGMYAVNKFIPIINPPEAAILGIGKAEKKVVPLATNAFEARDILTLTLACDHRAVDGALGSQFLGEIKSYLEEVKWENEGIQ